jgi:membrane-bound serine protease (ClpP class)
MMKRPVRLCLVLGLLVASLLVFIPAVRAQDTNPVAVVMTADGPLTPAMVEYIERGLQLASDRQAQVVIIQLDTPGGDIGLMTTIEEHIRANPIPVVMYVSPAGAMAGSAGTIITLSGHLAAMAPNTTIGAASPVGAQGQDISTTEDAKVKSILEATVRTLTQGRPPAAVQLAQDAIETAKAATVDEALKIGLIDFKATDLQDLLRQLNGRQVKLASGEKTIVTTNATVVTVPLNFIESLLGLLTDPNIVFTLLAIGQVAILIELSNPGGWVAGFVGATCLLLAVYGLGILPVNWFGILFVVLAFVLFILDIKAPTHGALTAAGVFSFIIGALVLFNSVHVPGFAPVSVPLVIGSGIFLGLAFFTAMMLAVRAMRRPVLTGTSQLLGRTGTVRREINPRGQVQVAGELWTAELADDQPGPLPSGSQVQVTGIEGLRLKVRKA